MMTNFRMKSAFSIMALCSLAATTMAADYTAWTGHRDIILNTSATGADVTSEVTNFPVLIRLGGNEAATLAAGGTNGASIRFSKADNATPLPYQIESWSANSAVIWVKVDTIKASNNTQKIIMHWGNGAAVSESNGPATFDTANGFSGVWHLHDSTGGISTDATIHNTNATWYNAPVLANGLIGKAVNMEQPGDLAPETARHLRAPYNEANNNFKATSAGGITLSVWVKRITNTGGNEQGILGRYNWGQNGRQAMIALNGNEQIRLFRSINGTNSGSNETNFGDQSIFDGTWFHIVATVKNGSQILYVNGLQDVAQTTANIGSLDSIWPTKSVLSIGRMAPDHTGNPVHQAFSGYIDEARYARTARSADWVKLEFANQQSINTLVNIGAPVVPGAPTAVMGTTGAANTGSIDVTWTAPAFDGGIEITSYKVIAVEDSAKTCTAVGATACTVGGLTSGASYTFKVRASNAIGGGPLSAASPSVNAPVPVLGGAVMFNVGAFTNAYTFRLSDRLSGRTDRLSMKILDVSGKTVWARSVSPSEAGREISWNGTTTTGARAPAGIYFVRVFSVTAAGKQEAVQGGVTLGR
jgi:hypothetical protein